MKDPTDQKPYTLRRRARVEAVALALSLGAACAVTAAPGEAPKKSVAPQKPAGKTSKAADKSKRARPAGKKQAESGARPDGKAPGAKVIIKAADGGTAPPPAKAPAPAPGPPAAPGPGAPGPTAMAAAPAGMIKLDFRGTDIDAVLQAFALAYKWTVVKDPGLTGAVTVIETAPMDQKRAFTILQAVLEVRGFTAILDGSLLKVMPVTRAIKSTTTVLGPDAMGNPLDRNQVITEVVPLSNAEAAVLAKDLEPLLSEGAKMIGAAGANALIITDTQSNIQRLKAIVTSLDKGAGNNEVQIFKLEHVPAKRMTEVINNLYKQLAPRQPGAPMPQPGQPPPPPGQPRPAGGAEGRPAVAAVEDERTNSVIVVGSTENLKRVAELVKKLDEELNPHNETKVYNVKYAEALKLAQLVNDGLLGGTAAQPAQPAQPSFGYNPFAPQRNQPQTASFSAGQTRIVADTRTNSLIITADADTMKTVEALLEQLDQPVDYETTTFAIKLKNQNAEDMAYVLAQAFGTQQQTGGFPFFFFGGNQNTRGNARRDRRIQRRLNNDNNNGNGYRGPQRGGAENPPPQTGFKPGDPAGTLLADASDPSLPEGAQRLAQFFYDYYNGNRGRGSDATTGRTGNGKYVNLLQLRGNVLVTPERNTNSLIITTSPENVEAVRGLITELDIETKQVLLEAIVAEISLTNTTKFGIDYLIDKLHHKIEGIFPVLPSAGPLGADPLASGFRYTIKSGDFQAVISAIAHDERVRILSTPRVFTSNNQEAEIDVTDSIPYLRGTSIGFGGQTQTNVEFLEVGLILNVTPRITSDGMVTVDVYQEDSNLVDFRNVGQDAVAPLTTQRVTDTSVTLRDGDTLVLSGLQKNSKVNNRTKIPVLGDIPFLGNLFRSTTKTNARTELVVFLTPRVVSSADEARSLSDQELERIRKKAPGAGPRIPGLERDRRPEQEPGREHKEPKGPQGKP